MVNTHRSWWRARWRRETPTGDLPETVIADFADRQALGAQVRQALQALPQRQRAVLVLADPVRHLETSNCSDGTAFRNVGGYTYSYPHPGNQWWRTPTQTAFPSWWHALNDFVNATPQQMPSEIKKVSKVTVIGPVSGPGWTGTRYALSESPGEGRQSAAPWTWTSTDEPGTWS